MKAIQLRTEYLTNPIGIDILSPRLFWNCEGGVKQTAYEIVATNDRGETLWQSGKIESDSMYTTWGASPVPFRTRVEWKIRLWDENENCGEWSHAYFETGIDVWCAKWVTGNYHVNPRKRYPVDCFRKCFDVKDVKQARLYITACGVYEARLNGMRCGDFVLAPGVTDYRKRIQYQTIDVTDLLVFRGIFSEIFRDFSGKAVFLCFFVTFSRRLTVYRQQSMVGIRRFFSLGCFLFLTESSFFYFPTNCTNVTNLFFVIICGICGLF